MATGYITTRARQPVYWPDTVTFIIFDMKVTVSVQYNDPAYIAVYWFLTIVECRYGYFNF